ncbi:MAG: hypothetical protein Q8P67_04525, partial [archaeon]|nr:hypothetical protein [archaeon]
GHLMRLHTRMLVHFADLHAAIEEQQQPEETAQGGTGEEPLFEPSSTFLALLEDLHALLEESLEHYAKYVPLHSASVDFCRQDSAAALVKQIHSELDVFSLLVCPIRRIPRYSLLFQDLDKHYSPRFCTTHPRSAAVKRELAVIIRALREGAELVNQEINRKERELQGKK